MFTSKKDEEIEALQAQVMTLTKEVESITKEVKSIDESWLDCRIDSARKDDKILLLEKEMNEMRESYGHEDARLRRMVASEKKRRVNNKNANDRKIKKLTKVLEAQEIKA